MHHLRESAPRRTESSPSTLILSLLLRCASGDRRSENVHVIPIIVAELELGDIERKVLFADLWKVLTVPRLMRDQRPSMVRAWMAPTNTLHDVLAGAVIDGCKREATLKPIVAPAKQFRAKTAMESAVACTPFALLSGGSDT